VITPEGLSVGAREALLRTPSRDAARPALIYRKPARTSPSEPNSLMYGNLQLIRGASNMFLCEYLAWFFDWRFGRQAEYT
jgi:hypothetical protein